MIFAFSKGNKIKSKTIGEMKYCIALLAAISKLLSEKLSEQNGLSVEESQRRIIKCIEEGMKSGNIVTE